MRVHAFDDAIRAAVANVNCLVSGAEDLETAEVAVAGHVEDDPFLTVGDDEVLDLPIGTTDMHRVAAGCHGRYVALTLQNRRVRGILRRHGDGGRHRPGVLSFECHDGTAAVAMDRDSDSGRRVRAWGDQNEVSRHRVAHGVLQVLAGAHDERGAGRYRARVKAAGTARAGTPGARAEAAPPPRTPPPPSAPPLTR